MSAIMMKLAEHAYMSKQATNAFLMLKGMANAAKPIVGSLLKGKKPSSEVMTGAVRRLYSISNLKLRELAATQGMSNPSYMKALAKAPKKAIATANAADWVGNKAPALARPAKYLSGVSRVKARNYENMYRQIASGKNPWMV